MQKPFLSTLKCAFVATLAYGFANLAEARPVGAYLIADDSECMSDHMVFQTQNGFTTAEWYAGLMVEGRLYFGEFHSYGFTEVLDENGDRVGRVWIDDFWNSNAKASAFCYREG